MKERHDDDELEASVWVGYTGMVIRRSLEEMSTLRLKS